MPYRTHVHYSGHVQGVGFRFTAVRAAADLNVRGFVRNLADGRVELVAEGDKGEVEELLARIDRKMGGYIHDRQAAEEPPTGEFEGFDVRYTR
jgi:acylphosphatase